MSIYNKSLYIKLYNKSHQQGTEAKYMNIIYHNTYHILIYHNKIPM